MRIRADNEHISVHAIAGIGVVLLGLDVDEESRNGLLGFNIFKKVGTEGNYVQIGGDRRFKTPTAVCVDAGISPIQKFLWGDYQDVDADTIYTYKVVPMYGDPAALMAGPSVEITVKTESPDDQKHAVFFNRGVAGSQAYARNFGDYRRWYVIEDDYHRRILQDFIKPGDVPNREAYKWLSRGLEEAIKGYIEQATGAEYAIRAAVYEFTYLPIIQSFVDALERGVDVKIIHHAKQETSLRLKRNPAKNTTVAYKDNSKDPEIYKNMGVVVESTGDAICVAANNALSQVGLKDASFKDAFENMMVERKKDTQISHNKFIVLLKDHEPIQVWTGSTNFTDGGIFGQSNVGHIVRDKEVAQRYYDYWQKLSNDPKRVSEATDPTDTGIANWTVQHQPDLQGPPPPDSITPIFSPRLTANMLEWYAERLSSATNSVFFTAAFSVANEILEKVKVTKDTGPGQPYLRYLLLEGISGLIKPKLPAMTACPQNRIAWGDTFKTRSGATEHDELIETLTGLNENVNYLHTKYMLIDPLSEDPIVITGSANFSDPSTTVNDENMLVIRGNTRVADIFLGEFMRLFNHFKARNLSNMLKDEDYAAQLYLSSNDSWTKPYYTDGSQDHAERLLFH